MQEWVIKKYYDNNRKSRDERSQKNVLTQAIVYSCEDNCLRETHQCLQQNRVKKIREKGRVELSEMPEERETGGICPGPG